MNTSYPNLQRKPRSHRTLHWGTLLIACALPLTLSAQSAPKPTDQADAEDVTVLSPFEVNAETDKGYVATNTLAGSRLNTALVDTPASISVLTTEFLQDIAANDINEAIRYGLNAGNDIGGGSADVGASTGNGIVGNDYNIQIRGYRNVTSTRDYFPTLLATDFFNAERVEIARGPNSLIFGVGGPGGIVNTAFKTAQLNRRFNSVSLQFGSWNKQRYALDTNQPIIDGKLAVRANLMHQEAEGWKDFAQDDQDRQAIAFTLQPFASTKIKVNAESGDLVQNRVRPWGPVDQVDVWIDQGSFYIPFGTPEAPAIAGDSIYSQTRTSTSGGQPFDNGLSADIPVGQTFERRTAHLQTPVIYLTDGPLADKFLWVGNRNEGKRYYRTSFSNGVPGYNTNSFVTDESLVPRSANPAGPGAKHFTDYQTFNVSVDQRIGEHLNVNFTAQSTDIDRRNNTPMGFGDIAYRLDVTTTLPTFTTDGHYNATLGGPDTDEGLGTLHFSQTVNNPWVGGVILQYRPEYSIVDQLQDDLRLSASYDLDLGKLGRHSFLAFAQQSTTESESVSHRESNISPNRPLVAAWDHWQAVNFTGRASHVDFFAANEADRGIPDPFTNPLPNSILWGDPNAAYANSAFEDGWIPYTGVKSKTEIESGAFAIQSYWLNRSLVTTAGIRRDKVSISNYEVDWTTQGTVAGFLAPAAPQEESDNTYSFGAVYHLPKFDWLSIYANKSTNFQPQNGAQAFEDETLRLQREIGALKGTGYDYGFKFRLFHDRIFATIGAYKVDQANTAVGYNSAVTGYMNAIWDTIQNGGPNDPTDGSPTTDAQNPNGHHVGGSETRDQVSEGYEIEITANLTDNWRVSFNASKSDNQVANLGTNISAYVDKHRTEWEQWRSTSYNTNRAPGYLGNNTVGDLIDGIDDLIDFIKAGEGLTETNVRPINANVFTAYSFNDGFLRGLTLGGGVQYRGDQIIGVNPATLANPTSETFKAGAYYLANAMVSYEFKLRDVDIALQLNVDNLLQNDDTQVLSSNYDPATNSLTTFDYFLEPRKFTVSARFSF